MTEIDIWQGSYSCLFLVFQKPLSYRAMFFLCTNPFPSPGPYLPSPGCAFPSPAGSGPPSCLWPSFHWDSGLSPQYAHVSFLTGLPYLLICCVVMDCVDLRQTSNTCHPWPQNMRQVLSKRSVEAPDVSVSPPDQCGWSWEGLKAMSIILFLSTKGEHITCLKRGSWLGECALPASLTK